MTNVAIISRTEALESVSLSLGLPETCARIDSTFNVLIAQSIRRSVFIAAPCSVRAARTIVTSALAGFAEDHELESRVGGVIEDLVATGDLLEMRLESANGAELVLRPAPPAFVKRRDGTFIILGVAGDEITPVHDQPVTYRSSGLRMLVSSDPDASRRALLDLGLLELSGALWLHAPAVVGAESYLSAWKAKLPDDKRPEKIEELELLDPAMPTGFYKGRWKPLTDKHSGIFLARRPQRYGANLWCLADVHAGLVQRLVDIHSKDARIRDCDEAWRILAASDSVACAAQKVAITPSGDKVVLAFKSPLPAWAVRRLSLIGERVAPQHALLGFEIPKQNMEDEVRWLEETLWLARDTGVTHDNRYDPTND